MIETNFLNADSPVDKKYNFNKGDYEALRSYMDRDWDNDFAAVNYELERMWNTLKTKIDDEFCVFFLLQQDLTASNGKTLKRRNL